MSSAQALPRSIAPRGEAVWKATWGCPRRPQRGDRLELSNSPASQPQITPESIHDAASASIARTCASVLWRTCFCVCPIQAASQPTSVKAGCRADSAPILTATDRLHTLQVACMWLSLSTWTILVASEPPSTRVGPEYSVLGR